MRVSDLLQMMASGARVEDILGDFPYLTADDVSAALRLCRASVRPPRDRSGLRACASWWTRSCPIARPPRLATSSVQKPSTW